MARMNVFHKSNLGTNLAYDNPAVQQRVEMIKRSFMAKGLAPDIALKSAYQSLDYTLNNQAGVQSYMDVFLFIGVMFLLCIPFVLVVKENKKPVKIDMGDLH